MAIAPVEWYRKIKALIKIKGMVENMKISEISTSEGRMTLLINIIGIYSAVQGFIPAPLMAKITVFSVSAYAIARAITKAAEAIAKITPSVKDDAIVSEVGAILDTVAKK